jgi:predicted RNA-binding protein with PUA-like domain
MRVTRGPEWPEEDPKAVWVEVQPVEGYDVEVRLADVKADASLAEWELVRMPRLSVMPVTEEQWKRVQEIRQERAGAALGRTRNTT